MSQAGAAVYEPRGKVKLFVDAARAEPQRHFTVPEAARIMSITPTAVSTHLATAMRNHVIFSDRRGHYSFTPIGADGRPNPTNAGHVYPDRSPSVTPPDDLRIPKFGAFVPPQMECTRAGAGQPVGGVVLADAMRNFPERVAKEVDLSKLCRGCTRGECWDKGCQDPAQREAAPALADASIPEGGREGDELDAEFDVWLSGRTGELLLVGVQADEEGRVTLTEKQTDFVRRLLCGGTV